MVPVAGSAYAYTYASLGEFLAFIVGWNVVQYYLLAVRLFEDGNERDDFASSGETGFPGSNEGFVPVGRCRDSDFSGSAFAPVSDTGDSFLPAGYDR